jgi:hypothetical protein
VSSRQIGGDRRRKWRYLWPEFNDFCQALTECADCCKVSPPITRVWEFAFTIYFVAGDYDILDFTIMLYCYYAPAVD